eukprot:COSAG02_NODE_2668_length_8293_cov_23.094825_4_plen_160_part_00
MAFKNGEFSAAAVHYEAALSLVARRGEEKSEGTDVKTLVLALRLNCAAARLKTAQPSDALAHCEAALVLDPCNSKAMYRKGQALLELGHPVMARTTLTEAYKLAKDKQVISLLRKADAAAKEAKAEKRRNILNAVVSGCSYSSDSVAVMLYIQSSGASF